MLGSSAVKQSDSRSICNIQFSGHVLHGPSFPGARRYRLCCCFDRLCAAKGPSGAGRELAGAGGRVLGPVGEPAEVVETVAFQVVVIGRDSGSAHNPDALEYGCKWACSSKGERWMQEALELYTLTFPFAGRRM